MSKRKTLQRFWLVWNPQGRSPTCDHGSKRLATDEAKRLAKANPGQRFFVMRAVEGFEADTPRVRDIKLRTSVDIDDGIPF